MYMFYGWRVSLVVLLHTMGSFYLISWNVISEWRSHSLHCFIIENSSKCKPIKIHHINIRCIVCNKVNNKRVFNLSVENTFIAFSRDIWLVLKTRQISLCKNKQLIYSPQADWTLGCSHYKIIELSVWQVVWYHWSWWVMRPVKTGFWMDPLLSCICTSQCDSPCLLTGNPKDSDTTFGPHPEDSNIEYL